MKRRYLPLVALLVTAVLRGGNAPAQSSGPASPEVLDKGQEAQLKRRMQDELSLLRGGELFGNPPTAATDRAELESFFRRLPGRFRIEGRIEQGNYLNKQIGEITGVADCSGVGEGLGVHCIINATWPVIDREVARIGDRESPSEILKTFHPAVLVLGVDPDAVRVQSLLVTADSFAHGWVGRLEGDTMWARLVAGCRDDDVRCFRSFQITAEPDSETVTLLLPAKSGIDITLIMHRDADARASRKLKSLKAR